MRIDDWRTVSANELAPWYDAERERWLTTLHWDTTNTWRTVESARQAGSLPGFVVRDQAGAVCGWSFYLKYRGELQIGTVIAPSAAATERMLAGIFQSPEARSADRWMAYGWFDAPGMVNFLRARGMAVEIYGYLHRATNAHTPSHHGNARQLRAWCATDHIALAPLLSSAYRSPEAARPFAANGTMSEWIEYSSHLLHGSACGTFDPAISRVAARTPDANDTASAAAIDGAAIMMRLMPTTAHLAQLVVQPSLQGRGLGRRLLVAALDAATSSGCECVTLLVRDGNAAARRLYSRLGFVERAQFVSASTAMAVQLPAVS